MKTVQQMLDEANAAIPRISVDDAKKLVGRADVLFLDVREPNEVAAAGMVPGAVAIPRGLVEFRACPGSQAHDKAFDKTKTVVAYCASGGRSAMYLGGWLAGTTDATPKSTSSLTQFSTSSRRRPKVCINDSTSKLSSGRALI